MLQEAGIDVRLGELAGAIQETMESYEVEIGNKVVPGLLSCSFIVIILGRMSFDITSSETN